MPENNSTVQYRDIPGFPGYRVGDDGSVWSQRIVRGVPGRKGLSAQMSGTWRKLAPSINKRTGRYQAVIDGKKRSVHRLVLLAFVGPCPEGMESCHEDGNRRNNALSNLRWDTHKANCADRVRHGTQAKGEKSGNSRFTEADIRSIRTEYATGTTCYSKLAQKHKTHWTYIRNIIKRRAWKHVA